MRIAVDAMGSDHAPESEVAGAIQALRDFPHMNLEIVLVGPEQALRDELAKQGGDTSKISIHGATDVIATEDDPAEVYKHRRDSSLYQGMLLHKNGDVDAFVSAGNTGAMMAVGTLMLGRIRGAGRPTIGAMFPTHEFGKNTVVVDVGANADNKPQHLFEFAVMGSEYVRHVLGVPRPRVGLLNIGEEKGKGTKVVQEADELLELKAQSAGLHYVGNVEGRDIMNRSVDVVVCDGFVGNIVLKFGESFLNLFKNRLKAYAKKNLFNTLKAAVVAPVLKNMLSDFNYEEHGGVPLLGVRGCVIIGHGSSSGLAVRNMISQAYTMYEKRLNAAIEEALQNASASTEH